MKKLSLVFLICFTFLHGEEKLHMELFAGRDVFGQTKVDRTEIKGSMSDLNFNAKGTISYKIYEMISLTGSVQYETYTFNEGEYSLVPFTMGIRYIDKKFGNYTPYVTMSYGTNIVIGIDEFPLDTRMNGFGEIDLGAIYKEKFVFELAYKHHALAHTPNWPSLSSFWNGQTIGVNIGYRVK